MGFWLRLKPMGGMRGVFHAREVLQMVGAPHSSSRLLIEVMKRKRCLTSRVWTGVETDLCGHEKFEVDLGACCDDYGVSLIENEKGHLQSSFDGGRNGQEGSGFWSGFEAEAELEGESSEIVPRPTRPSLGISCRRMAGR